MFNILMVTVKMSIISSQEDVSQPLNSNESGFEDENTDVFYFESDHLALKGNSDYSKLIKTVSLLEAQRIKLLKDIESLHHYRKKIENNPDVLNLYFSKIVNGDVSDFPTHTEIVEVPKIDWSKYDLTFATEKRRLWTKDPCCTKKEDEDQNIRVRGRVYNESKPQTFNQLWTAEEQLRLEELLLETPEDRIEYNRYRKIAEALGNRTPQQVCSRVQKYLLKLQKAGCQDKNKYKKNLKSSNKLYYKNSTFFPTLELGESLLSDTEEEDDDDENDALNEQLRMEILFKVLEKSQKNETTQPNYSHKGISCKVCGENPVVGTRWQCLECEGVNLCTQCVINQLYPEVPLHPYSHKMYPIGAPESWTCDPDYMVTNNYLDPNYMQD